MAKNLGNTARNDSSTRATRVGNFAFCPEMLAGLGNEATRILRPGFPPGFATWIYHLDFTVETWFERRVFIGTKDGED